MIHSSLIDWPNWSVGVRLSATDSLSLIDHELQFSDSVVMCVSLPWATYIIGSSLPVLTNTDFTITVIIAIVGAQHVDKASIRVGEKCIQILRPAAIFVTDAEEER